MANQVYIPVEDVNTALDDYTSIRLYRDTSPTGTFSTLVTTITLVADTFSYSYEDANGTAGDWYRYSFYTATGPVETAKGPAWQVRGVTLQRLRIEAAKESGTGFSGTADTGSTTTVLRDALLGDAFTDINALAGAWIYRPDAADSGDLLRRCTEAPFDGSDDLTVSRAWTNAPTNGEAYEIYTICAPIDWPGTDMSWDRAIRDALEACWFIDQVNLGVGTGKQSRYSLSAFIGNVTTEQIRRVYTRYTDTDGNYIDTDYDIDQRFWLAHENGPYDVTIELYPPAPTTEYVWAEVVRIYDSLYTDDDVTTGPERLAVAASVLKMWERANRVRKGRYRAEETDARQRFLSEYAKWKPKYLVRGL